MPESWNLPANAMVSFSCAYFQTRHPSDMHRAARYWEIILLFALGAGLGGSLLSYMAARTIWVSCLLLLISLCLMFIRDEEISTK